MSAQPVFPAARTRKIRARKIALTRCRFIDLMRVGHTLCR